MRMKIREVVVFCLIFLIVGFGSGYCIGYDYAQLGMLQWCEENLNAMKDRCR